MIDIIATTVGVLFITSLFYVHHERAKELERNVPEGIKNV